MDTATSFEPITQIELTFAERLRWLRDRRDLTQEELADLAGISRNAVGGYERGETIPRHLAMKALAEVLVVPVELLASGLHPEPDGPINLADRRSRKGVRTSGWIDVVDLRSDPDLTHVA